MPAGNMPGRRLGNSASGPSMSQPSSGGGSLRPRSSGGGGRAYRNLPTPGSSSGSSSGNSGFWGALLGNKLANDKQTRDIAKEANDYAKRQRNRETKMWARADEQYALGR